MPFGRYKGVPMQDVPASYLFYLWRNGMEHERGGVADYIRANLNALRTEHPDGIWGDGHAGNPTDDFEEDAT
jgi:uncharacterized protein (DUF3820 family)